MGKHYGHLNTTIEDLKVKDAAQIKDAIKVSADFYNQLTGKSEEYSSITAQELAL